MSRKQAWELIVAIYMLSAGAVAAFYVWAEPIRSRIEWQRRIQADLKTLARKQPTDCKRGQWDFAVGWTWQLNGNCGEADRAWRDRFADELERRLQGPVGLADIEWIWDEYAKHTAHGQKYSDWYRPTREPSFAGFPEDSISFGLGR